jgi:hypothetical protein
MGIQLPEELMNNGASGAPQQPDADQPLQTAPPAALPNPDDTFHDHFANGLAATPPQTVAAAFNAPGGWAKLIVANAVQGIAKTGNAPPDGSFASKLSGAVHGVGASLGDAAAVGTVPAGGGALTGISRTLAARSERKSAEAKAADEHAASQALVAENQARTIQTMRNIYKQDAETQQASYGQGKTFVDNMRQNHQVEEGVSQADISKRLQDNPKFFETHYGIPTGSEPVFDNNGKPKLDPNGNPVTSPIYSIVNREQMNPGQTIKVTPEAATQLKKAGYDVQPGQNLNVDQFQAMAVRATGINNAQSALEKANDNDLNEQQLRQVRADLSVPVVQDAIAKFPGRPLKGLTAYNANINQHIQQTQQKIAALQQKNPTDPQLAGLNDQLGQMQKEKSSLNNVIQNGVSDKQREDETKALQEEEKARHDAAQEALQNRRADIQAQKEGQQKGLGDSYKTENKEFDTVRKPIETQLDSFSTLRSALDQAGNDNAVASSVVAPALLKALVAGGGVRITQAEIQQFIGARSTLGDVQAMLNKWKNGTKLTSDQIGQVYKLVGVVEAKAQQKRQALEEGQDALDNATSVLEQRAAVANTRRKLASFDGTPQPQPQQSVGHKPGDKIVQNGVTFTVTSTDQNGRVTGAQ